MTIQTITYASHTAWLDPMTGQGLLIMPSAEEDLWLDVPPEGAPASAVSLQCADFDAAVGDLGRRGWVLSEPEDPDWDTWLYVGVTADGGMAIGLMGLDPIITDPTIAEMAEADAELLVLAGVTVER